jgi:dihydropteroate synthase
MGIVNITPDSFSDGGKFYRPEEAVRRIKNLIAEGADIIDIGAESTRPGATPLDWRDEWARLEPVLRLLSGSAPISVPISIDTYHPETAERALALGAKIINCVYEHPVLDMLKICQKNGAELIFPAKTLGSVPTELLGSVPTYIDPMIGFGTTREEDVELLKSLPQLARRGRVLVGASRKRIVKKLVGAKTPGKDIAGNLAIALFAAMNGASAVRVHDVKETVQALRVLKALQ